MGALEALSGTVIFRKEKECGAWRDGHYLSEYRVVDAAPDMARLCKHYNSASTGPNILRMLEQVRDAMVQKPK